MGYSQVVCIWIILHIQFTKHLSLIHEYVCSSPLLVSNWQWINSIEWCLFNLFVRFYFCSLFVWLWILSEPDPKLCFNGKIRGKSLEFTLNNFLVSLNWFFIWISQKSALNFVNYSSNRIRCVTFSVQEQLK